MVRPRNLPKSYPTWKDGSGKRYRDCTLRNFESSTPTLDSAVQVCRQYVRDFPTLHRKRGSGLLLLGPPGTGKDHLACGVLNGIETWQFGGPSGNELMFDCGFRFWEDLLRDFHDSIGGYDRPESVVLSSVANYDALVISDPVLSEGGSLSEFAARKFWMVVNQRYANHRPTIITANATSVEDLKNRIGEASASRLLHESVVVHMMGEQDYRQPSFQI